MRSLLFIPIVLMMPLQPATQNLDIGISLLLGIPSGAYELGSEGKMTTAKPKVGPGIQGDLIYQFNKRYEAGITLTFNSLGTESGTQTRTGLFTYQTTTNTQDYITSLATISAFCQYFVMADIWKAYTRMSLGYSATQSKRIVDLSNFSTDYPSHTFGEIRYNQPGFQVAPGIGVQRLLNDNDLRLELLIQYHYCFNSIDNETHDIVIDGKKESVADVTISGTPFFSIQVGILFNLKR